MIDIYYWPTPNGKKVTILLEELGIDYQIIPCNIGRGDQFTTDFLDISPNNRMPAMVDHDPEGGGEPIAVFESGAIMMYIAEKEGRFFPQDLRGKNEVIQWVMWQMGGPGPILGQIHHFVKFNPGKSSYAEERYLTEGKRLYGVLNKRLQDHEFIVGDYSIADIAIWPWISRFNWQTIDIAQYPNVTRWYSSVAARPAVQRGYHVPRKVNEIPMPGASE